jgi:hypothetical protein
MMKNQTVLSEKSYQDVEHVGHIIMFMNMLPKVAIHHRSREKLLSILKYKKKPATKKIFDLTREEKESLIDILEQKKKFFAERVILRNLFQQEFFMFGFKISEYLLCALLSQWGEDEKIADWYVPIKNSYLRLWAAEDEEGEIPSDVFADFIEEAYQKHIDYARFSPAEVEVEDLSWKTELDEFFRDVKIYWATD